MDRLDPCVSLVQLFATSVATGATMEQRAMESKGDSTNGRIAGVVLAIGSVITAVFMAIHPTGHGHDAATYLADLAEGAAFGGLVHGTLMASSCLLMAGLWGLADRLGSGLMLVRIGLIAYLVGVLSGIGAATINGFVLPGIALRHGSDKPEVIDRLRAILALCIEANGTLARIDVFATSTAVLLWSAVLAMRPGPGRGVGIFGLICGAGPLVALLAGRLPMNIHGFGAFILAQVIWTLAVAVLLVRGRV